MAEPRTALVVMKRAIKRILEHSVAPLAPMAWRFARKPALLVLMYHRVLPPDHPEVGSEQPGMHVSPATLDLHLQVLRDSGFKLVFLDDWIAGAASGPGNVAPLSCAITFDDGWRDNFDWAFPVLRRRQAPATIFLVSDLVGTSYSFWPNMLARLLESGVAAQRLPGWLRELMSSLGVEPGKRLSAAGIDAIIVACKSTRTDAQMRELVDTLGAAPPRERDLMDWDEIRQMRDSGIVRFGSHTRTHMRLTGVAGHTVLEEEVLGSRSALQSELGSAPTLFCYPNGDMSPAAVAMVRSGYVAAVSTQEGWHRPGDDIYAIRRIGVHEDIASRRTSFLARISGLI